MAHPPKSTRRFDTVDPTPGTAAHDDYPGAVAPSREYMLDVGQLEIAVHEWGDADDPPLFLIHGGFDFARTYDVFAPLIASGGWRVVSWD
jgi:hypothetical protein